MNMHRGYGEKKYHNLYKLAFLQYFFSSLCCLYVFASDVDALAEMSEYDGMSIDEMRDGVLEFIPQLGYCKSEQTEIKLNAKSEEGLRKLYADMCALAHQRAVSDLKLTRIAKSLALTFVQSASEGVRHSFSDDAILRSKLEEFNLPQQVARRAERTQRVEEVLKKAMGTLN